ncbi:MAG: DUF3467 domain-containing protein [Chitinophagaceae bacterium]|nr:DUF3467 domain-containing protein [Rubrivivax sp.]
MTDTTPSVDESVADEGSAPAAPRVVWNDAAMDSSFANVINVVNTREEFILLFGTNRSWNPAEAQEWKVDLSNRITLTPHAAKRLQILLQQRLQDYEERVGSISVG